MISIITPSRNRPVQFSFLENYMRRQSYKGDMQWIVVNDSDPEHKAQYHYTLGQTVIERDPSTNILTSICENYLAAIPHIKHDAVVCLDDDDWYSSDIIFYLVEYLRMGYDLVGLKPDYYYHVGSLRWREMENTAHASLATTAFSREVLPTFEQICQVGSTQIDQILWTHWMMTEERIGILLHQFFHSPMHVGIKGLDYGEYGLGMGHLPELGEPDPDLHVLRQWLGDDSNNYIRN